MIMNLKKSSEPFEIEYQIFVDMGEDGTKTVYSSPDYQKAKNVLEEIKKGNFTNVDLDEDEFKEVQNISLMQTLCVPSNLLQTIVYDGQTEVGIELSSINLEYYTFELCPHCNNEVILENRFEKQICPNCQKEIYPCSICPTDQDMCGKCPLEQEDVILTQKGDIVEVIEYLCDDDDLLKIIEERGSNEFVVDNVDYYSKMVYAENCDCGISMQYIVKKEK